MAGYANTPMAKKLGIKPGHAVVVIGDAPAAFARGLELPEGARLFRQLRPGPIDVLVYFVDRIGELERRFATLTGRMHPDGGMWIAWPTKASTAPSWVAVCTRARWISPPPNASPTK